MRADRLRAAALCPVVLLATGALVATGAHAARAEAAPVTVTVNTRAGLATVPDTGIGVNHAVWDGELGTPAVSGLLRDAGVRMIRYPGGSYGHNFR